MIFPMSFKSEKREGGVCYFMCQRTPLYPRLINETISCCRLLFRKTKRACFVYARARLFFESPRTWQFASVRNAASFFVFFMGVRVADPAGWLFWHLMAHPLRGEKDSTSPPRWL